MRAPRHVAQPGLGFNMTPMIDVVFQLIIFFLVSSHLAQQEVQLELDLPAAATGVRPAEENLRRVVVNVLPEADGRGRIEVAGARLDREGLERTIAYESRRHGGRIEVRIRCDRQAAYREVEPVMVACARSGVWKVTFAVVER
mgnify:CR=1 FL=1